MKNSNLGNLTVRYILLIFGLFIMAGGVAISAKSDLGVSPISSIPYVVSLMSRFTIGEVTIVFNLLLLFFQVALLRKEFPREQWLQLPVCFLFGYFIDMHLFFMTEYAPASYFEQWVLCLASFLLLGFGVFCEVKADVTMLSGEGVVSAITKVTGRKFSKNKILVDSSLVLLAVIISFIHFTGLRGVREGTIAAAIGVGIVAGICIKKITILDRHLQRETA